MHRQLIRPRQFLTGEPLEQRSSTGQHFSLSVYSMKTIFATAFMIMRTLVFALMLFFKPLVNGLIGLIGGLSLIGFCGALLLAREQTTAIFMFLGVGVCAVSFVFCYNWALLLLAPTGTVLIEDD